MLPLIAFVTGAVVMILELAATRVLAPFLGTSLFVWTSVLGVVLGGLSIGYFWGGRWVDSADPCRGRLGWLLAAIAGAIGIIPLTASFVLPVLIGLLEAGRGAALASSMVLFILPTVLLGAVTPFLTEYAITEPRGSGTVVGRLYACSTIGSVGGTFLAGFFLFAHFGTFMVLILLSLGMALLALACIAHAISATRRDLLIFSGFSGGTLAAECRNTPHSCSARKPSKNQHLTSFATKSRERCRLVAAPKQRWHRVVALGLILGMAWSTLHVRKDFLASKGVVEFDTAYDYGRIVERLNEKGQRIRSLTIDPHGAQAAVVVENPDEVVFEYIKFYRESRTLVANPTHIVILGAGGYTLVRDMLSQFPKAEITAIERDSGITELARTHFFYRDDPRVTLVHEDGRVWLNRAQNEYADLLLVDIFGSSANPPPHLVTLETFQKMSAVLRPNGLVMMNVMGALEGDQKELVQGVIAGLNNAFNCVSLFPLRSPTTVGNIMVLAQNAPCTPQQKMGDIHAYQNVSPNILPFTDDFSPVEFLAARLFFK